MRQSRKAIAGHFRFLFCSRSLQSAGCSLLGGRINFHLSAILHNRQRNQKYLQRECFLATGTPALPYAHSVFLIRPELFSLPRPIYQPKKPYSPHQISSARGKGEVCFTSTITKPQPRIKDRHHFVVIPA